MHWRQQSDASIAPRGPSGSLKFVLLNRTPCCMLQPDTSCESAPCSINMAGASATITVFMFLTISYLLQVLQIIIQNVKLPNAGSNCILAIQEQQKQTSYN
eukprot:m.31135 g.31135  ORF g.31135 m.31135 type:complete len:101 (-) comp8282_c0_seq1:11-313(-)